MKKFILMTVLTSFLVLNTSILVFAAGGVEEFNPGKALNDLKENNAVVGILYSLVFIEGVIIVFLWKRLDKLNDKLIQNYEQRLEREENLQTQITRLTTEMEMVKDDRDHESSRKKRN